MFIKVIECIGTVMYSGRFFIIFFNYFLDTENHMPNRLA